MLGYVLVLNVQFLILVWIRLCILVILCVLVELLTCSLREFLIILLSAWVVGVPMSVSPITVINTTSARLSFRVFVVSLSVFSAKFCLHVFSGLGVIGWGV
jgi:hypothetical protein